MNFKEKLFDVIIENKLTDFDEKKLASVMNIYSRFEKTVLKDTLFELEKDGSIVATGKGKYALPEKKGLLRGVISGNPKGFGFLIPEDGSPDVFLPPPMLNGALHGDTVWVRPQKDEKGVTGKVVSIIKRGYTTLTGRFERVKTFGFVVPDEQKFSRDIFVPEGADGTARTGDKVVVEITGYRDGKSPTGKITEIIGRDNTIESEMTAVVRKNGFATEFPLRVKTDAERLRYFKDAKRRDMTAQNVITIDGDDAKDFDDAVSLEKIGEKYKLSVHIADVSEYVKVGSAIDKEAKSRGTSVYYPQHVVPMLPEALSNGLCSLSEGTEKATLSVDMTIDKSGKVVDFEVYKAIIVSKARMTYKKVTAILDGDAKLRSRYAHIVPMLEEMKELADILHARRGMRGAIDFQSKETDFVIDSSKNAVVALKPYEYTVSNGIIEEFMLIANETVAEFVSRLEIPFIYRVHEKPAPEKLAALKAFVEGCGYKMPVGAEKSSTALAKLLASVEGSAVEGVVNKVTLRCMQKAKYSPENIGHYGLSSEFYCHFTSPIRRYPDLFVHRVLKLVLDGKLDENSLLRLERDAESDSTTSSERERAAELTEREIDDMLKAYYMQDKLGEEFEGIVSGVTQFGLFVELENTVEGLVHVDSLGGNFTFIPERYALTNGSVTYKLGDKLKVLVESADTESRKVRFSLIDD